MSWCKTVRLVVDRLICLTDSNVGLVSRPTEVAMISHIQQTWRWLWNRGKRAITYPAEEFLRAYLQKNYIERYGGLMELHIDPEKKTISVTLLPKGETQAIEITAKYTLRDGDDGFSVTISSVKTSREWLTLLAQDYLVPYTFDDIPRIAKAIL